jgi:hypothetical protein
MWGFGTLTIGTKHYAGIEYRIVVRHSQYGERATGVLSGSDEALSEAFSADTVQLVLEDGRVARTSIRMVADGQAEIRVIGTLSLDS